MANGMKMLRFFYTEMNSLPLMKSTRDILSLEQALEPIISDRIDQLNRFIQIAKDKCHFPSEHNLTRDESAAIYLYTMEWENDVFYRTISQSWLPYLTLLDAAIQKLPNTQVNVWRGVSEDICKKMKKDDKFIWWSLTSCSSDENFIKDSLELHYTPCFIEAVNGKDISIYSSSPNQNEIILCSGTRLQVVNNNRDQISPRLHLRECDRQVFSFLPHVIVLIIALLLGVLFRNTQMNYKSSSLVDQPSTFHTHIDALGNRYVGEWRDGKKHGKGKMNFANGGSYTGDWVDDMATGEGIFTWNNGDRYEGQIRNGRRHGKGSYYFSNGDTYIGDWEEDKKSGYGITSLSSGKYEGQFKDDKMHGKGTFYFTDGNNYTGDWVNDRQEGEGIFSWVNGQRFEGKFKASRLHGNGSYYFPNGNKFTGEWNNGERVLEHGGFTWANITRKEKENKTSENLTDNDDQIKSE